MIKLNIQFCFFIILINTIICTAQIRNFTVDFNSNNGTYKQLNGVNSVFLDSTNAGYNDMLVKEIRTHVFEDCDYWHYTNGFVNLTTNYTDTATYNSNFDPQLTSNYNFSQSCDSIINGIINAGFQAYFRLGVGWPNFANTNCYPCIPLSPPADSGDTTFHSFASICKKTVEHYTQGWDTGFFYTIPYWEVWNEPDGVFWKGNENQFYQLYHEVADSIKLIDTTLRVGTCGITSNGIKLHDTLYCDDLIHYCNINDVPLDFYSWHIYKRFNPYSIISGANYVRNTLNAEGFNSTQSHLTEVNAELTSASVYDTTAKGSAYVASLLMTCQETSVDKVFWFAGNGLGALANSDNGGMPDLTWKGFGMKSHNTLVNETPVKITSTGNSVIPNAFQDTTNVMIMAGKNISGTQTDILISNLNSNYDTLIVSISNLPYTPSDIIAIEQYTTQGPGTKYALVSDTSTGSSTMQFHVYSATAPSVYLFKISKTGVTEINESFFESKTLVYPNPADQILILSKTLYNLDVFSIYGQVVFSKKETNSISTREFSDGIYFIRADNANLTFIVKH